MTAQLSNFWKHVLTVLTGSVAAQILPLLAAPLITRLCTPEDMGAFSVWLGVIAITSIIATLRLETAMILDHGTAEQQTCLSVVIWFSTSLAILVTLIAVTARILGLPQAVHMSWTGLLTIGVGTWLTAYTQTVLAYATSCHAFGKAAQSKVWAAGAIAIAQLSLLFTGANNIALISGQIIGLAVGLAATLHLLNPPTPRLTVALTQTQQRFLVRHQGFWRFSLPADLLNVVAGQLPLFFIGAKYGAYAAGLFALTRRVLAAPVSLLAASVLEVFKRQSVQDFQTLGSCREAYLHTFKALVLLGCGPALLMFIYATDLFAWAFGESWREAGEFARILAPLYFLNFIASPLSYVFYVTGKQKIDLFWQIALFIMTATVFLAPLTLQQSLWSYTIGYSLLYVIYLFLSYHFSQDRLSAA